ncbi:transposase [Streptomyces sp. NPDC051582]|uniref:IS110 family transposase n=1 Tax=Streptomyces sp. NPDC051582 TaxID=3155167 RepID=UPI00341DC8CA
MIEVSGIGAFLGLDVGKGEHHATAVTPARTKAFDERLANTEPKLRELFARSQAQYGPCWSSSTSRPRSRPGLLRW